MCTYTVQEYETLPDVSRITGVPVTKLVKLNGLKTLIRPGQVLKLK